MVVAKMAVKPLWAQCALFVFKVVGWYRIHLKKNFFDFLSRFLVSDDIDKSFLRPQALTAVDFSLVIFRAE